MSRAQKKRQPAVASAPAAEAGLFSPEQLVEWSIGAALVVATLLVYCPCFDHPFVNFDDVGYVAENWHVRDGLSAGGVDWAFTTFDKANWHPLTWLSLQLDSTLYGGPKAGGFHLTNVLLHAANVLLLFLVLGRMTGAVGRSAVVAGLFALHPLHVESVAWVAERKDVLSTLFWILTLAAYLHYVRRPGVLRYLLVVLAFALGLLAKPMLVTLPCVLLLLDWWPLGRLTGPVPAAQTAGASPAARPTTVRRLLLEKLPLFALALASCAVTLLAQSRGEAVKSFEAFPPGARAANALLAYVGYLGKTFWPARLAVFYPHPGASVSVAAALGAGVLLVIITALVLGPGRRRPYLAVGWLWYVGTLVPVIGLVQVGIQGMADRYTYVPLIGVFLMLTWGAADLAAACRLPRLALAGAAAVALSACAVLSWVQVGYWSSPQSLWEHALEVTEPNVVALSNLAECYRDQGRFEAARRAYERAVAVDPGQPHPHRYLGDALAKLGRWEEAADEYRTAVRLDPDLFVAHYNLGMVLAGLGQWEEAVREYREALRLGFVPAAQRLHTYERLLALRPRLPALADGRDRPADDAEGLAFADLCAQPFEARYALAARLYADAFRARPALADDPEAAHRADAALAAARAGWGQGQDAAGLDEAERARWRGQALSWLRAELALRAEQARSDRPASRVTARQVLTALRHHADRAGLRDPAGLAKLPPAERQAWQQLWQDLDAARDRADAP
jgi:tetratricopeptide (TPR) repeat protein